MRNEKWIYINDKEYKMNNIRFSHNWNNKLSQTIFTTIRKYDYKKWNYYKCQEGSKYNVLLNGELHGKAILISVESIEMKDAPVGLLCSDTGMIPKDATKLFKKFNIDMYSTILILTFKRIAE